MGMNQVNKWLLVGAGIGVIVVMVLLLALILPAMSPTKTLEEEIIASLSGYRHGEKRCADSPAYQHVLADTVNHMLRHPSASAYNLTELEDLFRQYSDQTIDIISGNEVSSAVIMPTFVYETCETSSPSTSIYILDDKHRANFIGHYASINRLEWETDRWLGYGQLLDQPATLSIWHIMPTADSWAMTYHFDIPIDDPAPTMNIINGYQQIMLDYVNSSGKPPCQFNNLVNFFSNEAGVKRTYDWVDNAYQLTDESYRDIQIWTKDHMEDGVSVPISNWQDYCLS